MKVFVRFSSLALIMGTLPFLYAYAQDEVVSLDEPAQEISAADTMPEEVLKPEKAQEQELEPEQPAKEADKKAPEEPVKAAEVPQKTKKEEPVASEVAVTDEKSGEVTESPEPPVEEVDVEPPQEDPEEAAKKPSESEGQPDNQVFNTASERGETMEALPEEEEIPAEDAISMEDQEEGVVFEDKGLSLEAQKPAETTQASAPKKADEAKQDPTKTSEEKEGLGNKEGVYSAGIPKTVVVEPKATGFADIYARQLLYKTEAEKLTASLEMRQESYVKYQTEAKEGYRTNLADMYKNDSDVYRKKLAESAKKKDVKNDPLASEKIAKKTSPNEPPPVPEGFKNAPEPEIKKTASADDKIAPPSGNGEPGIQEKHVPPGVDYEGHDTEGKKVVMPKDAPEFDPSRL